MPWLCDRAECDPDEGCEWYCFNCDRPGCRCGCDRPGDDFDADELGLDPEEEYDA